MKFAVNYINEEVMDLSEPNEVYIKYPGEKWDLDTLSKLCDRSFHVVLHGVIPSSGSILDPNLLNGFETFSKYIISTKQQWLSFHFDYKDKYGEPDYISTLEKNLKLIRSYFPDITILLGNLPPVDNIKDWCADPKLFSSILEKYDLKMLLDIPHTQISAEYINIPFEDYINQFPLDKVVEVHFSGLGFTKAGKLYDGHIMAEDRDYKKLEYTLPRCKNLKMLSLEFAPTRDYGNEVVAKEYRDERISEQLYKEQQIQLKRMVEMVKELNLDEEIVRWFNKFNLIKFYQ